MTFGIGKWPSTTSCVFKSLGTSENTAAAGQSLQETSEAVPSRAQTRVHNSGNLVRLVAEQDRQKPANFPFNSYLALQRHGQEKSAMPVSKRRHLSHGFLLV